MLKLAIVVPCYNEEAVLSETTSRLTKTLSDLIESQKIAADSFVMFVNDGSHDLTWTIIQQLHAENPFVCGVNLAGNVGHQNALVAGLYSVSDYCDAAISIDADLQDDVNAIVAMVDKYLEGNDIVYGVRNKRNTDTWFKRTTALAFYSLMRSMGIKSVYNHADYRLMSQRAIKQLLEYKERNLFLRGIVPTIGYKTASVYYDRAERFAGESKYPLKKMIGFACDGITSFSTKPVVYVLYLGMLFVFISLCIFVWTFYSWIKGVVVPGWTSLMLSLWFCSGCVLIALGVLGLYIGKIYIEVKNRPRYNIENILMRE